MDRKRYIKRVLAGILAAAVLAGAVLVSLEPSSAVTVNGTAVKYNRLQFVYTVKTSGDTTTISWELWCTRTNSNYDTFKKSAATVVKVNSVTVANTNTYYDVRNNSKRLLYGTSYVTRSNGAAKTVPFYASVNLTGTSVAGTITVSGNISLPAYEAGTTDVTATVDWIDNNDAGGKRPESVTVVLYQNGREYQEAEVSTSDNQVTFTGLPKAYGGTAYSYTVGGSQVEDYLVSEPAASEIVYKYALVPEMGFRLGFSI